MERDTAYNLYHRVKDFKRELKRRGFDLVEDSGVKRRITPTKGRPNSVAYVGEIIDNRFLIVYTSKIGEDSRYDGAISGLQRLAEHF